MAIGPIDGNPRVRRTKRRRRGEAQAAAEPGPPGEPEAAAAAAAIPPLDPAPHDGPPVISAQLMGQSDPAEGAAPANSAARTARSAYLKVEWSGRYDRRTRRGRITKTDV
jgi:hypothetical protein